MNEPNWVDINAYSFDEFVAFLFARDVPPEDEKRDPWYWHTEVAFDPQRVCAYYKRLFREPAFLLDRFSKAQLEQGFWGIQSNNLDCSVRNVIWLGELDFSERKECVEAMFYLFRDLFSAEPFDTSVHMWWDSLCYDWHCGNRERQRGGEDLSMQDVMFQTLANILGLDSTVCQGAALHGLGHLHHPSTDHLIRRYLEGHPSLTEEWKKYALAAARFQVL